MIEVTELHYDPDSLPDSMSTKEMIEKYFKEKVVLYDSSKGTLPYILNCNDKEIKFIDTNKKEENGE